MPYITSKSRTPIHQVLQGHHHERLISNWLDSSYIAQDSTGQKYVYPGLIVAQDTTTKKFVPYSAGASYGTGSDTPVGVMDEFLDVTLGDEAITPVWHGGVIEAHCYLYGSAMGSGLTTVKTTLNKIKWV